MSKTSDVTDSATWRGRGRSMRLRASSSAEPIANTIVTIHAFRS